MKRVESECFRTYSDEHDSIGLKIVLLEEKTETSDHEDETTQEKEEEKRERQ